MSREPYHTLGTVAADLITGTFRTGRWLWGIGAQARARTRAAEEALAEARASREQQRRWFEEVQRERSKGDAGFATEAETRAALAGKGGRSSPLDRRKIR